ncbi:endonuclease domain-containing protein [Sphingobium sp. HBC34]|uniref:Endonuclease domain-containing protein n=1 Tax=Sphingobium cyanobacteriorum TaxID=3063954 RepID=A0ABT8ZQ26_9SPHN|nr:endonuclease domain-containing protein [Sphingobium sp. HBC34]MDO7836644.1 endonuclease domain-containing protein [Sphingobium sp. HBC34]
MFKDSAPKAKTGTTRKARQLRRTMTLPEVLVWQALRQRPSGLKFRRQHPSGPYILDFYCSDARLAIEVDGEAHNRADRPSIDAMRDQWLAERGIMTLRVSAKQVLDELDAVVRLIMAEVLARLPLHHPAAPDGPPPPDKLGEEF